jgi:AraC-like DNA-binding protein
MSTLCVVAGAFAFLLSVGNLLKKGKTTANVLFSLLIGDFAVMLAHSGARYARSPEVPQQPAVLLTLLAACGILIYSLFVSLAGLATERKKWHSVPVLLLIPSAVSDILVFALYADKTGGEGTMIFIHSLNIAVWAAVLFLCAVSIIHVFRLYFPKEMSKPAWVLFMISAVITFSFMIGLSGFLLSDARLFAAMDVFIALMVFAVALLDYRYPDALGAFRAETVKRRYERSLLAGLDVEGLIEGMKEMLRKTSAYRNEDFNLEMLSKRMGLSVHQVSELLNDRMGTNFPSFINGFRIEEAKRLLVSNPEMSILTVAMESGFGNKTSFNETFKRNIRMTPGQFRAMTIK